MGRRTDRPGDRDRSSDLHHRRTAPATPPGSGGREPPAGSRRGRRRRDPGFSLVEVLVAVVVLTAGLLGVAALSAGVAREARRSGLETDRTLVAQRLLDSIRQAGYAAAAGGRLAVRLDGRSWRAAWTVTEPWPGIRQVDLEVDAPGTAASAPGRSFTARLHRPSAAGAAAGAGSP